MQQPTAIAPYSPRHRLPCFPRGDSNPAVNSATFGRTRQPPPPSAARGRPLHGLLPDGSAARFRRISGSAGICRAARRPHSSARHTPGKWRGARSFSTSITSNRTVSPASSGRARRNAEVARAMRRRCRGETAEAASAAVARAFTSMIASTLPRRAMMSISPAGQRQSRATIRHKRSRK